MRKRLAVLRKGRCDTSVRIGGRPSLGPCQPRLDSEGHGADLGVYVGGPYSGVSEPQSLPRLCSLHLHFAILVSKGEVPGRVLC